MDATLALPHHEGKAFWNVGEAAEYLRTTRAAVYKLAERKAIPHIRLGRRLLFDPAEIRAWIDQHRIPPAGAGD